MIAYYAQIKWLHILMVMCSGSLFTLRGLAMLAGSNLAMAAPIRFLSYAIDTVLLTAALMLATMLPSAVFANGWLTVKLCLIVLFIVLGSLALRRGRTRTVRLVCFAAALLAFGMVIGVARAHHPLGWFLPLLSGSAA
jgi:uncharacterized membrane protein SirB2